MLRAESVNHASVPVNDLERARKFYVDMLGMLELPQDPGGGRPGFSVAERLGLGRTPLARLECGGLEVTLFQRPVPVDRDFIEENGKFHYSYRGDWENLVWAIENLDALRRAGYDVPIDPIWRGPTGKEVIDLYIIDPEGNLFELVARNPDLDYDWRTTGVQKNARPPSRALVWAESINHNSVPVDDLARAKAFYVDLLGLSLCERQDASYPNDPLAAQLGLADTRICRLDCGGVEVTLFERPRPLDGDPVRERGGFHYSYRTAWETMSRQRQDLDGLRREGYDIPCEPISRMLPGSENVSLYLLDPSRNLLELVGRPPQSGWRTPGTQP